MSEATGAVVLIVIFGMYFVPLFVAGARSMPNVGSVAVINVLLGWTVIGWIVALAMACGSNRPRGYPPQPWQQQPWGQQQWPPQPPPGHWPAPTDRPPGT
jgi:hypothetical protein